MTFYQTVDLDPDSLRAAIVQAKRQEDAVLAIFQRLRRPLTPSDVWAITKAAGKRWPLTSVRRALSDLPQLHKTDRLRLSPYGRPEHHWALRSTRRTNHVTGARNGTGRSR